jgi:hypothetical protein
MPAGAPASVPRWRSVATSQAIIAATTSVPPWARLRTPETPKRSVNPTAPNA